MQEVAEAQEEPTTMICPFCSGSTPATWNQFTTNQDELGRIQPAFQVLQQCQLPRNLASQPRHLNLQVVWTRCQNEACREYIVQVTRNVITPAASAQTQTETWFAVPKHKAPPNIDLSLVNESMRKDYLQAYVILEDAPSMSAVLSRRILSDLLKKYDGANHFGTAARIDKFANNPHHPSRLRDNLHYLREIADFGAHTQIDKTKANTAEDAEVCWEDVVINASKEEAEWTLKVVAVVHPCRTGHGS